MSGRISRPKFSFSHIATLGPLRLLARENGAFVPVLECLMRTGQIEIMTRKNFETTLKEAKRIAQLCGPEGECPARQFLEMAIPFADSLAYVAEEIRVHSPVAQKGLSV